VRPTVLIVCTASICRSPYAEFLIEDAFRDKPGMRHVRVGSAGIRPVRGGRICELVAARRPHSEQWEEFVGRHISTRATPARTAQARLILTASRSNRTALALIDPGARSRTFTLREAAWLGSDYVRDPSLEGTAAITAFACYLDSRRGAKPPPPAVRAGWFSRPSDPLSIADGHGLGQKEHIRTLQSVEQLAGVVARLITVGSASRADVSTR
jgi:protein-tyrosine phosphatase